MSTNKENLRGVLFSLFESFTETEEYYSRAAKVLSIDAENAMCTVQVVDGAEVDAKLQQEAKAGFISIPAVGSVVVVSWQDNTTPFVAMFSELSEAVFFGGENGGVVKVTELVSKLNTIESDLNTLKQAFSGWVPVPNDGGAALKAATATWEGSQITQTTVEDLANEKLKH